MSNEIIPFASAQLPAYLQNRKEKATINDDVVTAAQFPTLSIKGKVFTLVRDNEKKIMMTTDAQGDEMPAQSVQLNVIRANVKSRVFYAQSYVEGDSDGARPTCFSHDGVAPSNASVEKQATKCAVCPHAVWGSKMRDDGTAGEGTECAVNTRLAVTAPDDLKTVFLLRVPAGSRKNFADAVKAAKARNIPYNALVMKTSFDPTAPSPKLIFKPVGLLNDGQYAEAEALYDSEVTRAICGLEEAPAPAAAQLTGPVELDELDAAIATKAAITTAATPAPAKVTPAAPKAATASVAPKAKPAAAPAPVDMDEIGALVDNVAPPAPAPAPAPAPVKAAAKPAAAAAAVPMENLMADLDHLLGQTDD